MLFCRWIRRLSQKIDEIPCIFPASREFGCRDEFAQDCPLQRRVRLSPETAFVGRESRLSPRVCPAGLAAPSTETRGRREQRANRRQYLCRAIFQYRGAGDM